MTVLDGKDRDWVSGEAAHPVPRSLFFMCRHPEPQARDLIVIDRSLCENVRIELVEISFFFVSLYW